MLKNPREFFLRAGLVAVVLVFLVFSKKDDLWSMSIDLASHYGLTSHIAQVGFWKPASDVVLPGMSAYPKVAHALAAYVGVALGSTVRGLQVVALFAVAILWTCFAFIALSPGGSVAIRVYALLVTSFVFNKFFLQNELHGHELIGGFFFSQLVAQAMAALALLICMKQDSGKSNESVRYLTFVLFLGLLAAIHPVPALELFGVFSGILVLDLLVEKRERKSFRALAKAVGYWMLGLGAIILQPGFWAMVRISANNGSMPLRYFQSAHSIGLLGVVIVAISAIFIASWYVGRAKSPQSDGYKGLKYVGLYGASIAGLCLVQLIALIYGFGSEYAVKKYAYAMFAVLLIQMAMLPAVIVAFRMESNYSDARFNGKFEYYFLPVSLIVVAYMCTLPAEKIFSVKEVSKIEKKVKKIQASNGNSTDGYSLVMGMDGAPSMVNYMMSVGFFAAPDHIVREETLVKNDVTDFSKVKFLITTPNFLNDKPYAFSACRQELSGNMTLVNGKCVRERLVPAVCQGAIALSAKQLPFGFAKGFGSAEPDGRWTEGNHASIACVMPSMIGKVPKKISIQTVAFLHGKTTQTLRLRVNNDSWFEYSYDVHNQRKNLLIPVRSAPGEPLTVQFELPSAISPSELGISSDARKLGVKIDSISFD